MTKEVMVTIDGLQPGDDESLVSVTVPGIWHYRDGIHYIRYEEEAEDVGIIKNLLKLTPQKIEIKKAGIQSARMVFDTAEPTQACYHTPYGDLLLQIKTTGLVFAESPEEILATLYYTLSSDESHISDNQTTIRVRGLPVKQV